MADWNLFDVLLLTRTKNIFHENLQAHNNKCHSNLNNKLRRTKKKQLKANMSAFKSTTYLKKKKNKQTTRTNRKISIKNKKVFTMTLSINKKREKKQQNIHRETKENEK